MPSTHDRSDFVPPRDGGSVRAFTLALLAHAVLLAALTWGVNWKRTEVPTTFEAEIWSAAPQAAAPAPAKALPAPPPAPAPPPSPAPVEPAPIIPAPAPAPAPVKAPPAASPAPAPDVDIALEQEKKRRLAAQRKAADDEKRAEKLAQVAATKAARELKAKTEQAERDRRLALAEAARLKALHAREAQVEARQEAQKLAREQAQQQAQQQAQKQTQAAELRAKQLAKEQAKDASEKQAQAAQEKQRKEALNRMMGMAGATGGAGAAGSGPRASGPSAGYGGKVKARVKPNIVFTDDVSGNPTAEVEVRTTSDGTIISQRLIKSSGDKAWDDAVIKAIVRTGSMPRDVNGTVPSPMILEFKPKD